MRILAILASLTAFQLMAEMHKVPEDGLLRVKAGDSLEAGSTIGEGAAIEVALGKTPLRRGATFELVKAKGLSFSGGETATDCIFLSGPTGVEADIYYSPRRAAIMVKILEVHPKVAMKVTVWRAGARDSKDAVQFWDHESAETWSNGVPGLCDTAVFFGDALALGWQSADDNRVPPFGTLALRGGRVEFKSGVGWPYLSPRKIAGTGILALAGTGIRTVGERPCTSRPGITIDMSYFSAGQDAWLWGREGPIRIDGPVVITNGFMRAYKDVTFNGEVTVDSPYGPSLIERDAECAINGSLHVNSPIVIGSGNTVNGTVFMSGGRLALGKGIPAPRIEAPAGGSFAIRRVNDDTIITPIFWTPGRIALLVTGFAAALFALMATAFFFGFKVMKRSRELKASERERELERVAFDAAGKERLRLSMDLHDDFQQLLTSARFRLVAGTNFVDHGELDSGREQLEAARIALDSAQTGLRATLWTLSEESEASGSLLDLFRHAISRMAHWKGVVELEREGTEPKLARRLMGRLLMILQEAVGNAITHGDATKVRVKVVFGEKALTMTIVDNGEGFDAKGVGPAKGHFGLKSMESRAREGGGSLSVDSSPGKGARVEVTLPY